MRCSYCGSTKPRRGIWASIFRVSGEVETWCRQCLIPVARQLVDERGKPIKQAS